MGVLNQLIYVAKLRPVDKFCVGLKIKIKIINSVYFSCGDAELICVDFLPDLPSVREAEEEKNKISVGKSLELNSHKQAHLHSFMCFCRTV